MQSLTAGLWQDANSSLPHDGLHHFDLHTEGTSHLALRWMLDLEMNREVQDRPIRVSSLWIMCRFTCRLFVFKNPKVSHWGEAGWRCLEWGGSSSSSKTVTVKIMIKLFDCVIGSPAYYPALQRSGVLHILSGDTTDTTKDWVPNAELLQPGTWNIPPYFSPAVRSSNKGGQNGGTMQELRVDEVSSTDVIWLINLI